MQVEFDISLNDIAVFNQYHWTHQSRTAKCSYRLSLAMIPAIILLSAFLFAPLRPPIAYWLISLLVASAWLFFYPRLYQRWLKQMMIRAMSGGRNRGTLGKHLITINESGLHEKTEVNDSRWEWSGVEQVQQTDDYIFI